MKSLIIFCCFLLVHYSNGQNTTNTTVAPTKTCEDFLQNSQTCEKLRNLISLLKESASTLQDAVQAAVKAHLTTAKDKLQFIRAYIAEHITCEKVLTADLCTTLYTVARSLKLSTLEVRIGIEAAIGNGKKTAKEIFGSVIQFLTQEISCQKIFGDKACTNIESAIDKFHEQRSLLKEAIMSVALKHITNTKDMLQAVKEYIISKIVNFKCGDFLTTDLCQKLGDIAKRLKLVPAQVQEAIGMAIMSGVTTATTIYQTTIEFLTTKINCKNILTEKACNSLLEATKKLHEQRILIQEAIMAAAEKHITNSVEIYNQVKQKLIEAAQNFKCTDVMPEQQCNLLKNISKSFKVRSTELTRILKEAIVNGSITAQQIYQASIGALIEDAKELKCEDITDPKVCAILDNFASRINIRIDQVTTAVKEAIVKGKTKFTDILSFAKQIIIDDASCLNFFGSNIFGKVTCKSLEIAALVKGVTFDVVINKMKELYANGITTLSEFRNKIKNFINGKTKRSIEGNDAVSSKDEIVDVIMQIVGGLTRMAEKTKIAMKAELMKLYNLGKLKYADIKKIVKNMLNKYSIFGDEEEKEDGAFIEFKKKMEDFKKQMKEKMQKQMKVLKEMFEKMMEKFGNKNNGDAPKLLKEFEVLADQSFDEEFNGVLRSFL